jgi:hypothetical protein
MADFLAVHLPERRDINAASPPAKNSPEAVTRRRSGRGKDGTAETNVRLTDQTLSCAARALVATAERHAACLHLKRAMQAA